MREGEGEGEKGSNWRRRSLPFNCLSSQRKRLAQLCCHFNRKKKNEIEHKILNSMLKDSLSPLLSSFSRYNNSRKKVWFLLLPQ